jgi:hypothetical protein
MAYTFTFPTLAAYQTAKASGGDIYNALRAGSATNVARAAVSFIAELGRSVIDSVNVCVPYKEGGYVGDVLCYSASHGYFWLKSPRADWSTAAVGQTYFDSTTWPSSFVRIGFCFERVGKHGLICAMSGGGYAWSTDTSTQLAGVYTATGIDNGQRFVSWIAGVKEAAEAAWGSTYYIYSWPLPRTLWDAAVAAAKTGATSSGSAGDTSWSSSGGVATITVVANGGTLTVNPADYDYNFDRWYRENIEATVPGSKDTATALRSSGGVNNDGIRNTRLMYASGNSPAANYAIGYSVSAPDHGAGKWWIPSLHQLVRLMKVYLKLNENGAGFSTSYAYWSSTQCHATYAWFVGLGGGDVSNRTKTYGDQVRLISAFYIE